MNTTHSVKRKLQQNAANSEHLADDQPDSEAVRRLRVVSEGAECESEWKGRQFLLQNGTYTPIGIQLTC